MRSIVVGGLILISCASGYFLARYYRENQDAQQIVNSERYQRMVAEEEILRGESRIKRLETDLQKTQVKASKLQESLDIEKATNSSLRKELQAALKAKDSAESKLKDSLAKQAVLEALATQESTPVPSP